MNDNKSLARINFGNAVKNFRYKSHIKLSQEKLSQKLNNNIIGKPYIFHQKTISRLENGDSTLNLNTDLIMKISEICEIPKGITDELISEISKAEPTHSLINIKERNNLLTLSDHDEFIQYFGDYHCVFFSTNSNDPKIIRGKINIAPSPDSSQCVISLYILDGEKIIKKYDGVFFINRHYEMWYSVLIGQLKQEVCMLISKNIKNTLGKNIINIALALTTSAGTRKRPTMHRMLISRQLISEKKLKLIIPQLKLNTDIIYISEANLNKLENYIQENLNSSTNANKIKIFNSLKKCTKLIKDLSIKETYYKIDEALIYDTSQVSENKLIRGEIISIIRSYTDSMYYNKVSQTVQDIILGIIENDS